MRQVRRSLSIRGSGGVLFVRWRCPSDSVSQEMTYFISVSLYSKPTQRHKEKDKKSRLSEEFISSESRDFCMMCDVFKRTFASVQRWSSEEPARLYSPAPLNFLCVFVPLCLRVKEFELTRTASQCTPATGFSGCSRPSREAASWRRRPGGARCRR